jgi:hypothetical protein
VRGIEREVLVLGSLEQMEFDEAGHLVNKVSEKNIDAIERAA